jgi:hypothetical protein
MLATVTVCSSKDGKTYDNICLLKCDGAHLDYHGECKVSPYM